MLAMTGMMLFVTQLVCYAPLDRKLGPVRAIWCCWPWAVKSFLNTLYIALMILHTKQTGRYETDLTAHGQVLHGRGGAVLAAAAVHRGLGADRALDLGAAPSRRDPESRELFLGPTE